MEDSTSIQGGIALHNTVAQLDKAYAFSVNLPQPTLHCDGEGEQPPVDRDVRGIPR